jgi:XTP/dITP diphosphohydrolase
MDLPQVVLGTNNRKKGEELAELLAPVGIPVATLADFPAAIEVEETGATFGENAALKAAGYARQLKQWVLGEDSGLSVAALGGAPGVYSARWSGADATDESNNAKLLAELGNRPPEQRAAYYTCHICLSDPRGEILIRVEDHCHGRIRRERAGNAGFGYDPLFEIVEYHRTFGELGGSVKSCLSHRGRAMRKMVAELNGRFGVRR